MYDVVCEQCLKRTEDCICQPGFPDAVDPDEIYGTDQATDKSEQVSTKKLEPPTIISEGWWGPGYYGCQKQRHLPGNVYLWSFWGDLRLGNENFYPDWVEFWKNRIEAIIAIGDREGYDKIVCELPQDSNQNSY